MAARTSVLFIKVPLHNSLLSGVQRNTSIDAGNVKGKGRRHWRIIVRRQNLAVGTTQTGAGRFSGECPARGEAQPDTLTVHRCLVRLAELRRNGLSEPKVCRALNVSKGSAQLLNPGPADWRCPCEIAAHIVLA